MPKKEQDWFFSLNSSSLTKVSLKRVALNFPGTLQENVYENLIFLKRSLEKTSLLFRLIQELSEVRERERRELQSHIRGRTLGKVIHEK